MNKKERLNHQNQIKSHVSWLDQQLAIYEKALKEEAQTLLHERQLRQINNMKQSVSALYRYFEEMQNDNIEVFSTGGGFYQAEMPIKNGSMYAVVTNDYINMLCIYKYVDEDNKYYPKDMIFCENYEDIEREDFKTIYKDLHNALCEFMQSIGVSEYE